ncbi:MAG: DUF6062 family protein [Candidatus Bathyarchaeota archaeon]|nr:DUF6062 family protein [Candidatus Bathyarchaeota archaeon]
MSDITYLHLKRAVEKKTECFLCSIETEIEAKYLQTYLQELVMDSKAREKIIKSRGFCNNHFYRILIEAVKPTTSDEHGVALIMQSVIQQLMQDIAEQNNLHRNTSERIGTNTHKCPACNHLTESMNRYIKKTVDLLVASTEFSKLFKESKGLCIPHYAALTSIVESMEANQRKDRLKILSEVETKNLGRLNSELADYVRRQSYEYSEKDRMAVADVVSRSIEKIAGKRGIKLSEEMKKYDV